MLPVRTISATLTTTFLALAALILTSCGGHTPRPSTRAGGSYQYLDAAARIDSMLMPPGPADGDTVGNDPPGFHWLPEDEAVSWVLELSRDSTFPHAGGLIGGAAEALLPHAEFTPPVAYHRGPTHLVAGLWLPLHRPSFTLGAGRWYWRWRNVYGDATLSPPSDSRSFIVPDGAWEYTVPPLEKLVENIPCSHPRLFVRPEEMDSIRSLILTSEPHRELWARIEAVTDTLLAHPLMTEPPPYPESRDFRYELWRIYYDQARKMGQVLDFLGFCHLITGDDKYSDRAKEWLLHLAQWDPEGTSGMSYNDEVAMPILLNGARAYDWIYDKLSEPERETIRNMLVTRAEQAYTRWWYSRGAYHLRPYASHQTRLVNYMTQVATVLWGEAEGPRQWFNYLIPVITSFYPAWGGKDGGYSEGPNYWGMYFNYMLQSAFCLEKGMGLDVLRTPFYRNNGWFKIYADPWFAAQQPFADTGIGMYWPANKINLYRLASVFDNPYFRWRAEMSDPRGHLPVSETIVPSGIMSFFWLDEGPGAPQPKAPTDIPRGYRFDGVGIAALHQDPSDPDEAFILLKSSPYGAWSHIYADQNAFYIQAFGRALAIQSGFYPHYGHPHHTTWSWQTRAHNSVLVEGEGQRARDRTSRGKIIDFSAGTAEDGSVAHAAGDATEAYHGLLDKFVRHVYFKRPREFVVVDELAAPEPVRFDWLLHAAQEMEINEDARTVLIRRGDVRLLAEFVAPEKITFTQHDKFSADPGNLWERPDTPYPDQWHLVVSNAEKAKEVRFEVRMKVWREQGAVVSDELTISEFLNLRW
ncbi:MAG: DUF4962 domain-containing protein [Candidatus Glassbacteria bacterium]|nr:DUF4962 domain-containing protein [Candidatus Glassbacteria bacterium]